MYTFEPLAACQADHSGFAVLIMFTAAAILYSLFSSFTRETWSDFLITTVVSALTLLFAYNVSYVWSDQSPTVYANTQVTGEFVEFVAEGYNVTEHHGKTTRHVDKHFTYVVYKVDNELVMMPASVGITYPKTAILYKN